MNEHSNEPRRTNSNDLNESLFETTAITFSLEGISRDLETYIQKKITFNNRNFKHIATIINSISSCGASAQKAFLKKGTPVASMLEHSLIEMENTNALLTFILQNIISRENILSSELEKTNEKVNKDNKQ